MYTTYTKRVLTALISCLLLFTLCFTMYISAEPTSAPESSVDVSSEATSVDDVSSEVSSEVSSDSEPESTDSSLDSSSSVSDVSSEISGDASLDESSLIDQSVTESSEPLPSDITSSQATSSLVIETVSEGGAPDNEYYTENYYNGGSYVYEGSYAGLNSSLESSQAQEDGKKPARNETAQRYANIAKIGMIVFGLLSLGMIALLVYFNLKVAQSKKLHPEWYPKKEKTDRKPKH